MMKHRIKIGLVIGSLIGGKIVHRKFENSESNIAIAMKKEFKNASFYSKLYLFELIPNYSRLPELVPTDNNEFTKEKWSDMLEKYLVKLEKNHISSLYLNIQDELLKENKVIADLEQQIRNVKRILPDGFEQMFYINELLNEILKTDMMIPTSLLKKISINSRPVSLIKNMMIQKAILLYPDHDNYINFLSYLINPCIDNLQHDLDEDTGCQYLKKEFQKLDSPIQNEIIIQTLEDIFEQIKDKDNNEFKDRLRCTLRKNITCSLLDKHMDDGVEIFMNLSGSIQSKILYTFLKYKDGIFEENSHSFIKNIVNDTGIVAIKLSQILCEHPDTDDNLRYVFSSFLSNNEKVWITDMWNQIPTPIQDDILKLGKCKGVGSVKQLHEVKLKNEKYDDEILVIALIKPNVLNETIITIDALKVIPKFAGVLERLKSIIYQELDLHLEYKAFMEIKKVVSNKELPIELVSPLIISESNDHIIRTYLDGSTMENLDFNSIDKVLKLYDVVIDLAFNDNIILSDLHFGNILDMGKDRLSIIDPGQITHIRSNDLNVIMTMLIVLDKDDYASRISYSKTIYEKLKEVSHDIETFSYEEFDDIFKTEMKLCNTKLRFISLLNRLETNNVKIPDFMFAFAKMYDTMDSQLKMMKKIVSMSASTQPDENMEIKTIISKQYWNIFKIMSWWDLKRLII